MQARRRLEEEANAKEMRVVPRRRYIVLQLHPQSRIDPESAPGPGIKNVQHGMTEQANLAYKRDTRLSLAFLEDTSETS
jgi:hypothetical protein